MCEEFSTNTSVYPASLVPMSDTLSEHIKRIYLQVASKDDQIAYHLKDQIGSFF